MVICGDLIITKVQCFFIFIWTTVIVMTLKNGETQNFKVLFFSVLSDII